MTNKPYAVLLIILLSELFLVGFSFLYKNANNNFVHKNFRFLLPEMLVDFSVKNQNIQADSLLQNYLSNTVTDDAILKRTFLSKIGPKKQNIFLLNPDNDGRKALDVFFENLLRQKDSAIVRIAHYGDSQLEGDRMSYVIRRKMHEKFGGSGIGYVPIKDQPPVSYYRTNSGNWSRYTVFQDKHFDGYYGLSGAIFRLGKHVVFQKGLDDTLGMMHNDTKNNIFSGAQVSVKMNYQYAYQSISFLYGKADEDCFIDIYDNKSGEKIITDTLISCKSVCLHKTKVGSLLNIKIDFRTSQSPDFYGMYFDGNSGVQVDNYAIRGHSGDGLLLFDDKHLAKMLKLTNTKLIIFQYGANVVPFIESQKSCDAIGLMYQKLFKKFKAAAPDISILVIGAGDMAHGNDGVYSSYKWLPKISEMQKKAALIAGCAYWDLFNMMGGSNSVLVWTEKGLAVNDGHFSPKGMEIVANEIVGALMIEYNNYVFRKRKPVL